MTPPTTIRLALRQGAERLAEVSSSPQLDAQLLLADALDADRTTLFTHPERDVPADALARYLAWLARRADGEPLAYIRGWLPWYDRVLRVTPDVLVPRPETELLLERALALTLSMDRPGTLAADVGTGSGALAVTLAALRPALRVVATDVSRAALAVARANAAAHSAEVTFLEGDLYAPLLEHGLVPDLLLSNPPYVARGLLPTLAVAKWEPHLALDGGDDGLALVRRLLAGAREVCAPGAVLLLEIGYDQGRAATALARTLACPQDVIVHQDYAGLDRILEVHL